MRRSKFLVLTLVVAIMMMGAGYAYWTQELTITNNIDTGELDVVFENPFVEVDTYMDKTGTSSATVEDPYQLNVQLYDAYPAADITLSFDLANKGTLAAKVRDFDLVDDVNAHLVLVKSYSVENVVNKSFDTPEPLTTLLNELNGLNSNEGIFIEYEDAVTVTLNLVIDPEANSDPDSELFLVEDTDGAIQFTITAVAHQYNE